MVIATKPWACIRPVRLISQIESSQRSICLEVCIVYSSQTIDALCSSMFPIPQYSVWSTTHCHILHAFLNVLQTLVLRDGEWHGKRTRIAHHIYILCQGTKTRMHDTIIQIFASYKHFDASISAGCCPVCEYRMSQADVDHDTVMYRSNTWSA